MVVWPGLFNLSAAQNPIKLQLLLLLLLWKQHFENLLGNHPNVTHEPIRRIISKQLVIKLGQFIQDELDSVIRKIINRKAAGLDEITPEV